ncbi:cell envelope integrity protein TolA [Arenimonas alkanexedens]
MHADTLRLNQDYDDTLVPVGMAIAMHVALALLLLVAGWWQPAPQVISVAGPVVQASLVVSPSDVVAAEKAAADAPKPTPPAPVEAAPPPQPLPAPQPQDAPEEIQQAPQERIQEPSPIDQDAVARLALEQEQAREREEQEAKRRQEQVDLTERQRQEEVERRQRLREQQLAQLAEIRKQREDAERRTKMEEQRLQQLADRDAAPAERPAPAPAQPAGGNNGVDTDLAAKYALAMLQTAEMNWNRSLAPERTPCKVRFTQIPGGEIIDVSFLSCGFDAQARESVERALRRSPMPYAGFEPVFKRQIDLTFCYPQEACPR